MIPSFPASYLMAKVGTQSPKLLGNVKAARSDPEWL